jgi:hypothetical protein
MPLAAPFLYSKHTVYNATIIGCCLDKFPYHMRLLMGVNPWNESHKCTLTHAMKDALIGISDGRASF